jgi:hypothetical protein
MEVAGADDETAEFAPLTGGFTVSACGFAASVEHPPPKTAKRVDTQRKKPDIKNPRYIKLLTLWDRESKEDAPDGLRAGAQNKDTPKSTIACLLKNGKQIFSESVDVPEPAIPCFRPS